MNSVLMTMVVVVASGAVRTLSAQVGFQAPVTRLADATPGSPGLSPRTIAEHPFASRGWTGPAGVKIAYRIQPVRCPMPVVVPDSTKSERMPVSRPDSTKVERMPVLTATCVNPLLSKTRP